jgi:SsrA-binding protein
MSILALNKRANFDYDIDRTWEAGLVLTGQEVKSCRSGLVSLKEAYVAAKGGELYLIGVHIGKYPQAGGAPYEPTRSRKLLLKKAEINQIIGLKTQQGLTIVPIKLYTKGHRIKLELGLGRGRKKADKRELIKKRDIDREIKREIGN